MLVLSRKRHEEIVIGEEITISVLAIKGNQVKLGISCPREVPVHRKEIYVSIRDAEETERSGELVGCL